MMKKMALSLGLALLSLGSGSVWAAQNDAYFNRITSAVPDEQPWAESQEALPAYPASPEWVGFAPLSNLETNQPAINAKDLSLGEDGVVRYTLDVRSPSGVENISREGIRCETKSYRPYGFLDSYNKRWIASLNGQWQIIKMNDSIRQALLQQVCSASQVLSPEKIIKAMKADNSGAYFK